ncbi:hypothetical protein IE53DRAFT_386833 [Violaceomyces palustris]|uniref:Uncharacterized protein n=1 Tax=Violaceomyces palustris TaxID=1673888 RepID=A0ACD0NYW3_9BASI|nr:hypothetical protein IE53DRAFT_386833 [Violaceomyces palustris]
MKSSIILVSALSISLGSSVLAFPRPTNAPLLEARQTAIQGPEVIIDGSTVAAGSGSSSGGNCAVVGSGQINNNGQPAQDCTTISAGGSSTPSSTSSASSPTTSSSQSQSNSALTQLQRLQPNLVATSGLALGGLVAWFA